MLCYTLGSSSGISVVVSIPSLAALAPDDDDAGLVGLVGDVDPDRVVF